MMNTTQLNAFVKSIILNSLYFLKSVPSNYLALDIGGGRGNSLMALSGGTFFAASLSEKHFLYNNFLYNIWHSH